MLVPYRADNFTSRPYVRLNGSHTLDVSWVDVVWSAITAGKSSAAHLLAHRWHSLADMVVRTHSVYANLRQLGNGIDRSTLYDALDPTEKGATSYFLGMTMAKLFAAKLLDTPWLFHVSQATTGGAVISFKRGSKSQPDLIGRGRRDNWIVVEAKGRTNGLDKDALVTGKRQTRMIRAINGKRPHLRVALQAYFDGRLKVRLDDPAEVDPDALSLNLDLRAALSRYYAVAAVVGRDQGVRETIRNKEYVLRVDDDSGITIGVEASLLVDIVKGRFEVIRDTTPDEEAGPVQLDAESAVYPDGLFVRLDKRWSPELMTLEPDERVA